MGSILTTIKEFVGLSEDQTHFDNELISYINSYFVDVYDLGVGSSIFSIEDSSSEWEDFMQDDKMLARVIPYMKHRARLDFDPPTNSSLLEALNKRISELEWRICNPT